MKRRTLLTHALSGAAAIYGANAFAQAGFPNRPIRWVMPFPAGGPTDAIARKLAELASARLGQSVVVENKPGANGSIGTADVVRAPADGHTLAVATPDSLISVASLVKAVPYDARQDITPVFKICHALPVLVANTKLSVRTIPELITAAKSAPGAIMYGTWGAGTLPHLVMKSLESATGTKFLDVPYKGLQPVLQDLMGNSVQLALVPPGLAVQFQEKGFVHALCTTGGHRSPLLPNVASIQEQGVDTPIMKATLWTGLVGPKGMPDAVVKRWSEVLADSLNSPEFIKFLEAAGQMPQGHTRAEFTRLIADDYVAINSLIRSLGIQPL